MFSLGYWGLTAVAAGNQAPSGRLSQMEMANRKCTAWQLERVPGTPDASEG
jgi:hypothetical protein